jgi:hypothetical protein
MVDGPGPCGEDGADPMPALDDDEEGLVPPQYSIPKVRMTRRDNVNFKWLRMLHPKSWTSTSDGV